MERIGAIMDQINQAISGILKEGQERKEIRSDVGASHLAIMIMGGLRLFVKRWQMKDFAFDLIAEGASFLQTVKKIISKTQ
jgi:hypothetical protein